MECVYLFVWDECVDVSTRLHKNSLSCDMISRTNPHTYIRMPVSMPLKLDNRSSRENVYLFSCIDFFEYFLSQKIVNIQI